MTCRLVILVFILTLSLTSYRSLAMTLDATLWLGLLNLNTRGVHAFISAVSFVS